MRSMETLTSVPTQTNRRKQSNGHMWSVLNFLRATRNTVLFNVGEREKSFTPVTTLIYQARDHKFSSVLQIHLFHWWRLMISPAKNYEFLSVKLLWTWETTYKERAWRYSLGKCSLYRVIVETLANELRLDIVLRNIEFDHKWVVPREVLVYSLV